MTVAEHLTASREAHREYRANAGHIRGDGTVGSLGNEVIAEAAIKTALSHRQSAESMDPTHTDAAWALDNVKSGALIEFYETYLNGA